jgi:hypothetical protein
MVRASGRVGMCLTKHIQGSTKLAIFPLHPEVFFVSTGQEATLLLFPIYQYILLLAAAPSLRLQLLPSPSRCMSAEVVCNLCTFINVGRDDREETAHFRGIALSE